MLDRPHGRLAEAVNTAEASDVVAIFACQASGGFNINYSTSFSTLFRVLLRATYLLIARPGLSRQTRHGISRQDESDSAKDTKVQAVWLR